MHTRCFLPLAFLALSSIAHAQSTRPAFTLGKDTTLITEPLNPDGTVNYIPAINALLSQGVTTDNNAAILLLQLTAGRRPDPHEARFFDALHITQPDFSTRPRINLLADYLSKGDGNDVPPLAEFMRRDTIEENVREHPWMPADQPEAAAWLNDSAPALLLIEQACKYPRFYLPIVSQSTPPTFLDGMPFSSSLMSAPKFLAARAMCRAANRDLPGALDDLRRARTLARFATDQNLGIFFLVALSSECVALRAYAGLATAPGTTRDQLLQIRKELNAIPLIPQSSPTRLKVDQFVALDALMSCIRGNSLRLMQMMAWDMTKSVPIDLGDWNNPDWNAALNETVRVYDAAADAGPDKPYQDELRDINAKIAEARDLKYPGFLPEMEGDHLKSKIPEIEAFLKIRPNESRTDFSRRVARWLAGANPTDLKRNLDLHQRMVVNHTLALLALDLADYRLTHGHYPNALTDLGTPAPLDPFADNKPFQYTSDGTSFTLRSVGLNTDGIPLRSHPEPTTQPAQ